MPDILKVIRSMVLQTDTFNEQDIIILVVGPAGSGKTSFINKVAKEEFFKVGRELAGGSTNISCITCTPKGEIPRIVLVDTPPYPDGRDDETLFKWLKSKSPVKGIIYLHPITTIRGWPNDCFVKFRTQGGHGLLNVPVILVTTHWRRHEGETKYLKKHDGISEKWKSRFPDSSPVVYDETYNSARGIVQGILDAIERNK